MTRTKRNATLTLESLEGRLTTSTVPVVLATISLSFVPVSTVLMQQTSNTWTPPLDKSPVPLVPGGPG